MQKRCLSPRRKSWPALIAGEEFPSFSDENRQKNELAEFSGLIRVASWQARSHRRIRLSGTIRFT